MDIKVFSPCPLCGSVPEFDFGYCRGFSDGRSKFYYLRHECSYGVCFNLETFKNPSDLSMLWSDLCSTMQLSFF